MIYVGADHAGRDLKNRLKDYLEEKEIPFEDLSSKDPLPGDDYPSVAFKVAKEVAAHPNARGLLVCGSGVGMAIAANKVRGVRAANIENVSTARRARKEDNLNILVIGERVVSGRKAMKILKAWLKTDFSYLQRHQRRLQQIRDFEES